MGNYAIYVNPDGSAGGTPVPGKKVIIIDSIITSGYTITPSTAAAVSGLNDGSLEIISPDFANAQVEVIFGGTPLYGIDPLNGDMYYTKGITSDTITLSQALSEGDIIRIIVFADAVPNVMKTFTGIDVSSVDYDASEPGIYLVSAGGVNNFNLPDATLFYGQQLIIINKSAQNTLVPAALFLSTIPAHEIGIFYSINGDWYGK